MQVPPARKAEADFLRAVSAGFGDGQRLIELCNDPACSVDEMGEAPILTAVERHASRPGENAGNAEGLFVVAC
jgi:hypothetical protein